MIWLSPSLLTFGTRPDRLGTLCTGPCNVPYKVWCNLRLSIHVREDNKHFNMFIRRFIPTIAALLPSGTMNNSNSGSRNTWLLVAQYNKYASSAKSKRRSKDRQCWKCSAIISSAVEFFCPSCNIIQKPSKTATYFELLNRWKRLFDDLRMCLCQAVICCCCSRDNYQYKHQKSHLGFKSPTILSELSK